MSVLLPQTNMTEAKLKSNYFKSAFKLILFVSSVLFLSVTASWFVTKRINPKETQTQKSNYEKYVAKVKRIFDRIMNNYGMLRLMRRSCPVETWSTD